MAQACCIDELAPLYLYADSAAVEPFLPCSDNLAATLCGLHSEVIAARDCISVQDSVLLQRHHFDAAVSARSAQRRYDKRSFGPSWIDTALTYGFALCYYLVNTYDYS